MTAYYNQARTIYTTPTYAITVSGATVGVPAGYYASEASKSVSSGSATAPNTISYTTSSTANYNTNYVNSSSIMSVCADIVHVYDLKTVHLQKNEERERNYDADTDELDAFLKQFDIKERK